MFDFGRCHQYTAGDIGDDVRGQCLPLAGSTESKYRAEAAALIGTSFARLAGLNCSTVGMGTVCAKRGCAGEHRTGV